MSRLLFVLVLMCVRQLERLNIGCLPAFWPLHDVELHGLTFLQTTEATGRNGRVVHEDIFAVLARDEAEALRVVKPLHCTLFHCGAYPE